MILFVLLPFDVDPNVVKPGWTPLIITILLALVMVGLFISMRRQFRKIDVPRESDELGPSEENVEPEPGRASGPTA